MRKIIKGIVIIETVFLSFGFIANWLENRKQKKGQHIPYGPYEEYFKRPLDIALSLGFLVCFAPILLAIGILVKIKLGSPIIFSQERPGKDGEIFKLHKFRSMTDEKDGDGNLLPDEVRLTPFGKKLRSTSLDELPEFFNILVGDMSIIGPRPLLAEYLPRYNARQARRHEVLPGLTGLAQVNGRNNLSWQDKFEEDVKYVDHITFAGDLKILLKTISIVLSREGISSDTSVTMEGFQGNE